MYKFWCRVKYSTQHQNVEHSYGEKELWNSPAKHTEKDNADQSAGHHKERIKDIVNGDYPGASVNA